MKNDNNKYELIMKHIKDVNGYMGTIINDLKNRSANHDQSSLGDMEQEISNKYIPKMNHLLERISFYKSDIDDIKSPIIKKYLEDEIEHCTNEYNVVVSEMESIVNSHFKDNRHHPRHFKNGINDMNLVDIMEMLSDWLALSNNNENIIDIINKNKTKFKLGDQLESILINTVNSYFKESIDLSKGLHYNKDKVVLNQFIGRAGKISSYSLNKDKNEFEYLIIDKYGVSSTWKESYCMVFDDPMDAIDYFNEHCKDDYDDYSVLLSNIMDLYGSILIDSTNVLSNDYKAEFIVNNQKFSSISDLFNSTKSLLKPEEQIEYYYNILDSKFKDNSIFEKYLIETGDKILLINTDGITQQLNPLLKYVFPILIGFKLMEIRRDLNKKK